MKKIFILFFLGFFLVSCNQNTEKLIENPENNSGTTISENSIKDDSKAKNFVENISKYLQKTAKDVTKGENTYHDFGDEKFVSYHIKNEKFPSRNAVEMDYYAIFDGFVETNSADGVNAFYVEYIKDNLICSVNSTLNEDEYSSKYFNLDENASYEEVEELFMKTTRTIEISCSEFDNEKKPLFVSFDAFGGGDVAWNASISGKFLNFSDVGGLEQRFFIDSLVKENNILSIKGSDMDEKISVKIEEKNCQISKEAEILSHKISLTFGGKTYNGCASKTNEFFTEGRQGKLASFLKATEIDYNGKISKKGNYEIFTFGDFVEISFFDDEISEERDVIILSNGSYDDDILWNGSEYLDEEICDDISYKMNLDDFGVFAKCPKG